MRILALCAVLLACAAAHADEAANKEEARRLTELGTHAFEQGDHQAALSLFERADRVFPSANFAYNRGLALAGMGRVVDAVEAFETFLKGAPDAPVEARAHAQGRIDELGKQLGAIELLSLAPGTIATLDGIPVALGRPVRVRAGAHLVSATAPGRTPVELEVTVTAGQVARPALRLAASPAAAAATPAVVVTPAPRDLRPLRAGAIAMAGVTLALAGAGVGTWLGPWSEYQAKQAECAGRCAPSTLEGLRTRVGVAQIAGGVLWGLAAAAAVADITLWVLDVRGRRAARALSAVRGEVRF